MKKIWLRKEREDSKSQQELKTGPSDSTFREDEVAPSRPPSNIRPKVGSDGIAEQDPREQEPELQETEDCGSSKIPQKYPSAPTIPENGPYSGSFYRPMDASHIHPAYILAIQEAMDPYQIRRQIHFAVPNPFSFVPLAQIEKYVANGSHYDLPQAGNYDSYLIQSGRETRRFSDRPCTDEKGSEPSKSCDPSSQNHSTFDYPRFSYFSKASMRQNSEERSDRFRLPGSDLDLNPRNLRQTFARPEPYASQVRKRAPNSPLEVPITPTAVPGREAASSFPRSFVVPKNMMRLSSREDHEGTRSNPTTVATMDRKKAETTLGILPTVIANMTELGVNDDDKLTKTSNDNINETSSSTTTTTRFNPRNATNNVPNFRPYESLVTSSSMSSSSSSTSLNGNMQPVGKTEHRVTFKLDQRHEANDRLTEEQQRDRLDKNNNNLNNSKNNNSRSTASAATGHPQARVPGNAVSMVTDDTVANADPMKDRSTPTVGTAASYRGKGRPAKAVGKQQGGGADPTSVGGLRSVIKCPTCMKVFNNSSALAKHKLTHSDERKYSCHLCSKAFKRQDHLNGHMMTHSSKKPFECKFLGCNKSYCDARSLRRHLENHHHDSINSCNGLAFGAGQAIDGARPGGTSVQPTSLVRPDSSALPCLGSDEAWNSKVVWAPGFNPLDEPKPVRCHVCGRRFKNVPALNGHMRLHGGYVNRDASEDDVAKPTERHGVISTAKTFEEKSDRHHGDGIDARQKASSLERLSSASLAPWDLTGEELDRIKSKSCSLPREEAKFEDEDDVDRPPGSGNDEISSEKMQVWKEELTKPFNNSSSSSSSNNNNIRDSSSRFGENPNANGRPIIGLTCEETLRKTINGEFVVTRLEKEAVKKTAETSSREVKDFHYSKYSNNFQTIMTIKCSRSLLEETTMDLSRKSGCPETGSEISPKRLEASSLYQRRLRRFSERSPNSDESSHQSGGTPSPLNLEKLPEKGVGPSDSASVEGVLRASDRKEREKGDFFTVPVLASRGEEFEDASKFPSMKISCDRIIGSTANGDLRQCQEKISCSYPTLYQNSSEAGRSHPTIVPGDSYCKSSCTSVPVQSGTPVENPNFSLQHQSHSSLPCTPYTAHTPYTPRTTEPSSPRRAGFFQFPPDQRHESSKILSAEMPPMPAFDDGMETARIPEFASGDAPSEKREDERKPSDFEARNLSEENEASRSSSREEYISGRGREFASSLSEDSSHLNYLKARGKLADRNDSTAEEGSQSSILQEKQKEKLSSRRKAKPAPLVLPPRKQTKERHGKGRDPEPRSSSPAPRGVEPSRTVFRSTASSIDSGCPKSSARFSADATSSGFLQQSGDSIVFDHLKERCAVDFQGYQKMQEREMPEKDRRMEYLSETGIKVGPEYQASIPQLVGRLQVNQGMHQILIHLEEGQPR